MRQVAVMDVSLSTSLWGGVSSYLCDLCEYVGLTDVVSIWSPPIMIVR